MRLSVLLIVLQLIYLEGILSLDNAAVLAAMVSRLPRADPIPWPRSLRFLGRSVDRVLGGQRQAALKVGLVGAYVGRAIMLVLAAAIVHNRWLLFLGGLYLIKLGVDYLGARTPKDALLSVSDRSTRDRRLGYSFWSVVLAVELADLAFSLDNVVAAVALSREFWVVLTGVALGILLMRIATGVYERLLRHYPILETAGYLLVLIIGIELLLEEFFHVDLTDTGKFAVSLGAMFLSMLYARSGVLQGVGGHLAWLKSVLGVVSLILDYPLKVLTRSLARTRALARVLTLVVAARRRPGDVKRNFPI